MFTAFSANDKHNDHHEHGVPQQQFPGACQQPAELAANGSGVCAGKQPGGGLADINKSPAADHGIERQYQE